MNVVTEMLNGFLTWQTPVSFLAGVGTHRLWVKFCVDKEALRDRNE